MSTPDLTDAKSAETVCPPRLRRAEAVKYLRVVHGYPTTVSTLAKLACVGGGPAFQKVGRIVLYPREELDRWAESRISALRNNTSEAAAFSEGGQP